MINLLRPIMVKGIGFSSWWRNAFDSLFDQIFPFLPESWHQTGTK